MATTTGDIHSLGDELNLKKKRTNVREVRCDPIKRTVLATGEFYEGLAEAIAAGLRSFNAVFDTEESSSDLPTAFFEGAAEANARFYEQMAATSRRTAERLRAERQRTVVVDLDYEKLARLVAAELRRTESTATPSTPGAPGEPLDI